MLGLNDIHENCTKKERRRDTDRETDTARQTDKQREYLDIM